MKQLQAPVAQLSRELQRGSGTALNLPTPNFRAGTNLPMVRNVETDVVIPSKAWSSWIPAAGKRELVRPLTPEERSALERRRDDLVPAVSGYPDRDGDRVALALADMFGSFPSMRHSGDEVVARIDGARRVMKEFPAWAIEKACEEIQSRGVFRDGKYDKQWPPSDAEIADVVREKKRLYGDSHASAVALLAATVEE